MRSWDLDHFRSRSVIRGRGQSAPRCSDEHANDLRHVLRRIPKRKSFGLSLSKTLCFLFSVLNWAERSFLSISISLYFVMQSSCCLLGVASQLGYQRSCRWTGAVGYSPVSVSFESQAHVVALLQECQYVLFEILLGGRKSSARRTTPLLPLHAELTSSIICFQAERIHHDPRDFLCRCF